MSSSYFDIDDLPGPSNRRSTNREVYISAHDSGYGASVYSEEKPERPTLVSSNTMPLTTIPGSMLSSGSEDTVHRLLQYQVQQLHYNENRSALGRAISTVMNMLKELQSMNREWPAQYPAFRSVNAPVNLSNIPTSLSSDRPAQLRRVATDLSFASSSQDKATLVSLSPSSEVPRLMSSQLSHEFNVLKLDLKLGAVSPADLVCSLEKSAIASLLDGKISQALKHLLSLRERIEDTSSKVLVTGDLNAGKSTFCNALLRRNVLPEDQQPCTNVFCEVLDAQINNGVEEVHAIPHGSTYNRQDERTYDVFPISQLERLAVSPEIYMLLKIYIEDKRPPEQSLLRNGVVDIALIDAPGLNMDSMQTTAVFARQEEIDVVVFVVSAENHFTLSAKEFIWNAAHEKAFIFIVVNRFDNIRDKNRCSRLILEQVAKLSPRTYNDSDDLVHFVSSNKVPKSYPDDGDDGDDNGDDGNGGTNNHDDDGALDFENLERCLRNFILEKRAISKLAPAKTYLLNVLGDLEALASYNEQLSQDEVQRLKDELAHITPAYEISLQNSVKIAEEVDGNIEKLVTSVYEHTRYRLENVIAEIGTKTYVDYPGIFSIYSYAAHTRDAMLHSIQQSVVECEEFARKRTTSGFLVLQNLGLQHFQGTAYYTEKIFNNGLMFSRRKDLLARGSVSAPIEFADYIDLDQKEKISGLGMSITLATAAGTGAFGLPSTVANGIVKASSIVGLRNLRKWIVPALGLVLVCGAVYVISDIPNVVPRKLAKKLKRELESVDYIHANSDRISGECRKVLKYPAEDLRSAFQQLLDEKASQKNERTRQMSHAKESLRYFSRLYEDSRCNWGLISELNLEGVITGCSADA
ncbi:hypothetical protein V1508DRAFT_412422 [Lipomyces doorenjongii]|uniref:uncharacterized protein n=1 Tax=Lipomyces doorenjongii TaxID=383834 RepID=UPI0034CD11CD